MNTFFILFIYFSFSTSSFTSNIVPPNFQIHSINSYSAGKTTVLSATIISTKVDSLQHKWEFINKPRNSYSKIVQRFYDILPIDPTIHEEQPTRTIRSEFIPDVDGIYTVKLTVFDKYGYDSKKLHITVGDKSKIKSIWRLISGLSGTVKEFFDSYPAFVAIANYRSDTNNFEIVSNVPDLRNLYWRYNEFEELHPEKAYYVKFLHNWTGKIDTVASNSTVGKYSQGFHLVKIPNISNFIENHPEVEAILTIGNSGWEVLNIKGLSFYDNLIKKGELREIKNFSPGKGYWIKVADEILSPPTFVSENIFFDNQKKKIVADFQVSQSETHTEINTSHISLLYKIDGSEVWRNAINTDLVYFENGNFRIAWNYENEISENDNFSLKISAFDGINNATSSNSISFGSDFNPVEFTEKEIIIKTIVDFGASNINPSINTIYASSGSAANVLRVYCKNIISGLEFNAFYEDGYYICQVYEEGDYEVIAVSSSSDELRSIVSNATAGRIRINSTNMETTKQTKIAKELAGDNKSLITNQVNMINYTSVNYERILLTKNSSREQKIKSLKTIALDRAVEEIMQGSGGQEPSVLAKSYVDDIVKEILENNPGRAIYIDDIYQYSTPNLVPSNLGALIWDNEAISLKGKVTTEFKIDFNDKIVEEMQDGVRIRY